MLCAQLMESDRHLSQYSIGRGDTRLASRLSRRKRTQSAPPGGLPTVTEYSTKLVDWRQRFIEVPLFSQSPDYKFFLKGRDSKSMETKSCKQSVAFWGGLKGMLVRC